MSENVTDAPADEVTETTEPGSEFAPITSQEDFDKAISQRLARQKAQFAGYAEYKSKAEKLDEIERANQSELDRIKADLEAERSARQQAEFSSLRAEVSALKGVPAAGLTGTTREELEASADALLEWHNAAKPAPTKIETASSGGGLKSGASGNDNSKLSPKEQAAEALRKLRSGR